MCSSYFIEENWWLIIGITLLIATMFGRPRRQVIKGQTVLITGGGMGIGKLMAQEFAKEGCNVVIWDIRKELAETTAKEIVERHGGDNDRAFSVECDVSSSDSVSAAATETLKKMGHIDILVNNAGIVSGKLLTDLSVGEIQRTFGVNVFSNFWTLKEFLPLMLERKSGHIVTISSVMGTQAAAGLTDYCASKFATVGFAKCLRLELQKLSHGNVTSTLICPYAINTGMFDGLKVRLQWLYPILEPSWVARRVVDSVIYREDMVMMPKSMDITVTILSVMPMWLTDLICNTTGALDGMDHFKGHNNKKKV